MIPYSSSRSHLNAEIPCNCKNFVLMYVIPMLIRPAMAKWARMFHFERPKDLNTLIGEKFYCNNNRRGALSHSKYGAKMFICWSFYNCVIDFLELP